MYVVDAVLISAHYTSLTGGYGTSASELPLLEILLEIAKAVQISKALQLSKPLQHVLSTGGLNCACSQARHVLNECMKSHPPCKGPLRSVHI